MGRPGRNEIVWDGRSTRGEQVASGGPMTGATDQALAGGTEGLDIGAEGVEEGWHGGLSRCAEGDLKVEIWGSGWGLGDSRTL